MQIITGESRGSFTAESTDRIVPDKRRQRNEHQSGQVFRQTGYGFGKRYLTGFLL